MKNKAKGEYLLIKTDGYSIDTYFRNSYQEAEAQMRKEYLDAKPKEEDWEEGWADMSYLESYDAILYTGENVFVWRIVKVTEGNEEETEMDNKEVRCKECGCLIEDIEECKTDQYWTNDGDRVVFHICPECEGAIEEIIF